MEKEFVPYELALELKELGFNEGCVASFQDKELKARHPDFLSSQEKVNYIFPNSILAPLYQQAFRWFREEHNLISSVTGIFKDETKTDLEYWYYILQESDEEIFYSSYEEAELECLKQLIKIVKNK